MKACASMALALFGLTVSAQTTVRFAKHNWIVKQSSAKVGPGPNFFSNSTDNVWVDEQGLHLKITKARNRWSCAEVICADSLGYGTYRFHLASEVDKLDPNVVLGLFTWNDDPAFNHRELDIEFSRWGDRNNLNAQYVVQPYTIADNMYRFNQPSGAGPSAHSFLWTRAGAYFLSLRGYSAIPDQTNLIDQKTFSNGIPEAGGENARMNLWLFRGRAPTDKKPVEVIIHWFEFEPASLP